jgi:hypothetical protein
MSSLAQHGSTLGDRSLAGERILDLRGDTRCPIPQHVAGAATVMIEALSVAEIFIAGREPAVRPNSAGRCGGPSSRSPASDSPQVEGIRTSSRPGTSEASITAPASTMRSSTLGIA